MAEKYISHKNIQEYFNNNIDKKIMKLYISFVGTHDVNGYKSISTSFKVIEPTVVYVHRKKEKMEDVFGMADALFDELDPTRRQWLRNENPLFPSSDGNITHFDWMVELKDYEDNKLEYNDELLKKIKFYPTKKMADLNFVRMLKSYLDESGLLPALSTYDRILDTYTDIDPADLMKHL